MNQLDYPSIFAMHDAQLLKEAENSRLLAEAFKKNHKSNRIAKFLVMVGEKLVKIGNSDLLTQDQRSDKTLTSAECI